MDKFKSHDGGEGHASADHLDPRVLSSVLVSVKMAQFSEQPLGSDPQENLLDLMHTPEIRALLDAAQAHAERQGIPAHEGLQQIVTTLQQIDRLWNHVLLKEGLARLNSGYH